MASRYWVGGTANWDATAGTKWATTSGGAGGAAVPTTTDDVFFDAASGAGTTTFNANSTVMSVTFTGYTGTFTFNNFTLTINTTNVVFVAGMTLNMTQGTITFTGTGAMQLTTAGKSLFNVTMNGTGGTLTLQDALTCTGTLTLTKTTLDTNGMTVSVGGFNSSNSSTRTLTLGASAISCSGDWTVTTVTGLTLNANTSTITMTGDLSGTFQTFSSGNKTYNNLVFDRSTSADGGFIITGASFSCANFTCTGRSTSVWDTFTLQHSGTITVTGTLTVTGNSQTKRVRFYGNTTTGLLGTARAVSAAAVSLTNVDIGDITASGAAAPWTGTSIGNMQGNTSITATASVTRYWVGDAGSWNDTVHWSASSGGASGATMPLPQDDVVIDASSFTADSQTIFLNTPNVCRNITTSAATKTHTLSSSGGLNYGSYYYGNMTLGSNTGLAAFISLQALGGRGAQTLTWGGAIYGAGYGFYISAPSGTYTLQDTLSMGADLNVTQGTFDGNGNNVTLGHAQSLGIGTKTLTMGGGTWTLTGTGSVFDTVTNATGTTLNTNSSPVSITDTSSTAKSFLPTTGKTFGNFSITGGGTGSVTIFDTGKTMTVANFTVGKPKTVIFFNGSTTTVTGTVSMVGTAGNLVTLQSASAGLSWTFSKASGTVACNYLSLQDSTASGDATFFAGHNSTNVSGNSGWLFRDVAQGSLMTLGAGF